jgi:hypothetical protein
MGVIKSSRIGLPGDRSGRNHRPLTGVPEATLRYLVVISIVWIVALLLIFVPLAIRLYRKLT